MFNDNVSEALRRLSSDYCSSLPRTITRPAESKITKPTFKIVNKTKLTHKALYCLIHARGISSEIAKQYLHQIFFTLGDNPSIYYAL
jgi:hypothetical protein